jgi:heme/copper-type cytochrome/quinol oxidase subunit 3
MNDTVESIPSEAPRRIDVRHLSTAAWDSRSPVWWGNLLLTLIETTTVALMIGTYFYLRRNFGQWPPPRINELPFNPEPLPHLLFGTLNLVILLASVPLTYVTDMAARRSDEKSLRGLLPAMLGVAVLTTVLRFYEFGAMHVKWDENAYGSAVWWILGLHLSYLLAGAGEYFIMTIWTWTHELDEHHALDVTLIGGFWYWVAGTWVVCYLVLYWCPRWM